MRVVRTAALFMMGSLCVAQQKAAPYLHQASADVITSGSCPISVEAWQHPRAPYLLTGGSAPETHPVYTIDLRSLGSAEIREVTVNLVGPTGLRYEHVTNEMTRSGDAVERFNLTRIRSTHVAATRVTAVRWIDLVHVVYTDGTTWTRGPQNSCRIAPIGFVPVS